ncbi:serine hydrolase domain-containing protein [Hoeflea ulvae]|uniref:Beta-lactamase family protein n=1 Tax=Hoeflea ulvae TaxID=2983764 RepID=A0ABT3YK76_9HYPH|nr:serine hydrolase [Hoeflea ulvae]MCY0096298.1 beta-lactamase family protein [Hoeflea ulvae]
MARATEFETRNGFARDAITLANWRTRPYSFWSFRNVAEMVRSARIKTTSSAELPDPVHNPDLLARPAAPGASHSIEELLTRSEADSFILSRNNAIVCEWHAPGVDRSDPHLVFSISKSITALVAGILQDQGVLDPATPVGTLVPEAAGSAYADATVQHLLDMRVSLDFDESYLSLEDYARYRRAMSWNPPSDAGNDEGMLSFLCSLKKADGEHGGIHDYLSPNSDMLGIVLERATGERFPDLCARLLWQPLGATADALITVDLHGAPRTAGGVSCRPHDLLAMGQMLIDGGVAKGNQIVSARWIADMQQSGDADVWARGTQASFLKTGRYRNNWYQVGGGSNAFLAAGIHGQFLYCDPDSGTVIACTSSQSEPQSDALDQGLLAMFAMLSADG